MQYPQQVPFPSLTSGSWSWSLAILNRFQLKLISVNFEQIARGSGGCRGCPCRAAIAIVSCLYLPYVEHSRLRRKKELTPVASETLALACCSSIAFLLPTCCFSWAIAKLEIRNVGIAKRGISCFASFTVPAVSRYVRFESWRLPCLGLRLPWPALAEA